MPRKKKSKKPQTTPLTIDPGAAVIQDQTNPVIIHMGPEAKTQAPVLKAKIKTPFEYADILKHLLSFLFMRDIVKVRSVSLYFKLQASQLIYAKLSSSKIKVTEYPMFSNKVSQLQPEIKCLILQSAKSYNLEFAQYMSNILNLSDDEFLIQDIYTKQVPLEEKMELPERSKQFLLSPPGRYMFCEGFIRLEDLNEIVAINDDICIREFFSLFREGIIDSFKSLIFYLRCLKDNPSQDIKNSKVYLYKLLSDRLIANEQLARLRPEAITALCTDIGYKFLNEKLISSREVVVLDYYMTDLCTEIGYKLLSEQLISSQIDSLKSLIFCLRCLKANPSQDIKNATFYLYKLLSDRLIANEQLARLTPETIRGLCTDIGYKFLNEKLISSQEIVVLNYHMRDLCTDIGYKLLSEQLISFQELVCLKFSISDLCTEIGYKLLSERLISSQELVRLRVRIEYLCTDHGYKLLNEKLISAQQIVSLGHSLDYLCSDVGYKLLKEELISSQDLINLRWDIQWVCTDIGYKLLQEKLLTAELIVNSGFAQCLCNDYCYTKLCEAQKIGKLQQVQSGLIQVIENCSSHLEEIISEKIRQFLEFELKLETESSVENIQTPKISGNPHTYFSDSEHPEARKISEPKYYSASS